MAESVQKLSEEQLYESLSTLNVPARISDLKSPTRAFMIRVLECFLKDLMVDITGPNARTWKATEHFEEAELYEDAQPLVLLFFCVNYIIQPTGLTITIQDILEPKPKRTKKVLNYIIVFWLYYLKKYSRFVDIEKAFESEKQKISELVIEKKAKEDMYRDLVDILEERKKNEQFNSIKEKKQKILNFKNQKDEYAAEYQAVKTEKSNIENEICSDDVNITTAKEKLKEFEQLILSSPDRVNADLQKLKDKVKVVELKAKEKETEICEKKMKLLCIEGYSDKGKRTLSFLQKIMEAVQNFCDLVTSVISEKEKLDIKETETKTLKAEVAEKEDFIGDQDRTKAKRVLNLKIEKDSLCEAVKRHEQTVSKKKETKELQTKTENDLELKVDAEVRSILELHKKYKEHESEYHEMLSWFETSMDDTLQAFQKDCEEIALMLNIKLNIVF